MKILVAADGSEYTKRMLTYLAAHDEWTGPQHQYTVLSVVAPIPPHAASMLDRDTIKAYQADAAEKIFKSVRTFLTKQGIEATYVSKMGNAGELISKYAADGDFDLLVMGSRGHGSFGNLVLGSVVTRVVAHCKTPVLLVR